MNMVLSEVENMSYGSKRTLRAFATKSSAVPEPPACTPTAEPVQHVQPPLVRPSSSSTLVWPSPSTCVRASISLSRTECLLTGKVPGATKPVMQPETTQSSHGRKESPLDSNNDHLSRSCQRLRFCVAFNNYNYPIIKGGYIFVCFLGHIAKQDTFCLMRTTS
ncbi:hypothetical protein Cgig2_012084 [Carnegiea gigantea]|uniref:Uncharacterized protein n=1 Tax=Carnegiea gigantea TaxID=171969 RepID=A0A9Q1JFW4_9CARY|nr:hypothetical protein Cgig2_012084 [Carnegiea gigantea]